MSYFGQKFLKITNKTPNIFFGKNQIRYKKNAEFYAEYKTGRKNEEKVYQTKIRRKKLKPLLVKGEKITFSRLFCL